MAELYFGVVLWGHMRCLQQDMYRLGVPFEKTAFVGPALSPGLVLQKILQLAADACVQLHGQAGKVAVHALLNAHGETVAVRQSGASKRRYEFVMLLDDNDLAQFLEVAWEAPSADELDRHGKPCTLNLEVVHDSLHYICRCLSSCVCDSQFARKVASALVAVTQRWHATCKHRTSSSMQKVEMALSTAQQLSVTHNLFLLQQDADFWQSFLLVEMRGADAKVAAMHSLKRFLQNMVDDAAAASKCHWCRRSCQAMLMCGGCRVVRYCSVNKEHQMQASRVPFFSLTVSHKKICSLLKRCKSLTDLSDDSDPGEIAGLVEAYDAALWQFLQTDIMAKYVQQQAPPSPAQPPVDGAL